VLVGGFAGGLAYVNVLASMFFGTISGSAVAATSAVGGFMIPSMEDEGYEREYSVAVTMTGSATGLLIPPSNVLIVYSLASGGVSIAALFVAGYVPGILLGLALMLVGGVIAVRRRYPVAGRPGLSEGVRTFFRAIPSLLLIVIVMGGIVAGIFTATEASAIAVVYSLILAVPVYREVHVRDLPDILLKSAETTAIVMFLIATSTALSWILSYENLPQDLAAYSPVHQPATPRRGHLHGHHAGGTDLHADLPPGGSRARNLTASFWHHDGAQPVYRAVHAARGIDPVRGMRDRTDDPGTHHQGAPAVLCRDGVGAPHGCLPAVAHRGSAEAFGVLGPCSVSGRFSEAPEMPRQSF
jgi:hypothetical protein